MSIKLHGQVAELAQITHGLLARVRVLEGKPADPQAGEQPVDYTKEFARIGESLQVIAGMLDRHETMLNQTHVGLYGPLGDDDENGDTSLALARRVTQLEDKDHAGAMMSSQVDGLAAEFTSLKQRVFRLEESLKGTTNGTTGNRRRR